jgi:hypothetical protein
MVAQRSRTGQEYNILDIINQFAPREHRVTHNPRSHYMMSCPLPTHDDRQHRNRGGSFSVNEEGSLFICFGCGARGNGYQLHGLLSGDLQPRQAASQNRQNVSQNRHIGTSQQRQRQRTPVPAPAPAQAKKPTRPALQGVTVAQLSDEKQLDIDYLFEDLAWRNTTYFGKPAIAIPYPDADNADPQLRYRVGLNEGDKFRWEKGSTPRLYGLWNLPAIKARNSVILVEGETDYATLDYHGFPVLGIPGAQNYKSEWNHYLADIEDVYAWQEPDEAGAKMVARLHEQFPHLKVLLPPPGIKDPCEMALQAGDGFSDMLEEMIATAEPPPPPHMDMEIRTCFITLEEMKWNNLGFVINDYLDRKKDVLVEYLARGSIKDTQLATNIKNCYNNYLFKKCQNTGEVMAVRCRCGDTNDFICNTWLIKSFLDSKDELLSAGMEEPTLYRIKLFSQRLHTDPIAKQNDIAAIYKSIRQMLTRLTDSHGTTLPVAKDHLYGIRSHFKGDIGQFEIVLMGDYNRGNVELLQRHFQRQTGVESVVEERRTHGLGHAKELFSALMAIKVDWDTPETYMAWKAGTKGMKIVQGKGRFFKISGGAKGAKKTPEQIARQVECRVCGACVPETLYGVHPVVTTAVREVTSPYTGQIYLEPVQYVAALYGEEPAEGYLKKR